MEDIICVIILGTSVIALIIFLLLAIKIISKKDFNDNEDEE